MRWQLIGFLLLAASGCARENHLLDPAFDQATGETVVKLRHPVVFSEPQPALSAFGRDFVYLGPLEIDRMGTTSVELWVGFASTVDYAFLNIEPASHRSLRLDVDGESLTLPLHDWHSEGHSPYAVPIPLIRAYRTEVSLGLLETLGNAQEVGVALDADSDRPAHFSYWGGEWADWSGVGMDTGLKFRVRVFPEP